MTTEFEPVYGDEVQRFVENGLWQSERTLGENVACIGFRKSGTVVAGFVFHDWSPEHRTIEVSVFATTPQWCTRGRLDFILSYPFDTVGVHTLAIRTSAKNRKVRRFWQAMGAWERVLPQMWKGQEDMVVSGLTAEQWRSDSFLKHAHG